MPPQVVCVVGPTASGKTALGVWLAKHYNGEVVSCDSMQIYRRMDIGTAKPTREEMRRRAPPYDRRRRPGGGLLRRALPPGRRCPWWTTFLPGESCPSSWAEPGSIWTACCSTATTSPREVRPAGGRSSRQKYDEEGIQPLWEALTEIDPGVRHPAPPHGHQAGDPGAGGVVRDRRNHLRPQRRHPAAAAPLHGAEAGAELRKPRRPLCAH